MSHKAGLATPWFSGQKVLWLLGAGILLVVFGVFGFEWLGGLSGCGGPSDSVTTKSAEKPEEEPPKPVIKTIKVAIRPDGWTEWIPVPDNMNFRIKDRRKGMWLAIKFWDGRCWDSRKHPQGVGWLGEIPNSNFKLQGNSGEVEIIFEPIRQ